MQGAPTAISRNPVAEGLGQAEVTHLDSLLDVMQTKVNAKLKIVGFYKELPVLATGWILTVESPLVGEGKLGAGKRLRMLGSEGRCLSLPWIKMVW